MQINLNTDCAIKVLLNLFCAGCSVTINRGNKGPDIPNDSIASVILKLMDGKTGCRGTGNPDQHNLIMTPGKVTLKCIVHDCDDVIQIFINPNKNLFMSLSNLVISALDNNLTMNYQHTETIWLKIADVHSAEN